MKKSCLIYFLVAWFLIGCSANSTPSVKVEATPSVHIPTSIATEVALPTATAMPTSIPATGMNYVCLEISENLPPGKVPDGVLIFKNEDNSDAFLWNVKSGSQMRFPSNEGDRLLSFDVSPDGRRVIYRHTGDSGDESIIARPDGVPIWSEPARSTSWFDNDRLMIRIQPTTGYLYIELLNPVSSEHQELYPDFPNIDRMFSNNPIDKWRGRKGFPMYDPTLTKVVYPECDSTCEENIAKGVPDFPVVLFDIPTGRVLARLETMNSYGGTPIWLPDGSQFIISADTLPTESVFSRDPYFHADEFYAISREGQIRQLTDFMDDFVDVEIYDSYTLSPNGQWMAFWVIANPSNFLDARLAVMNTTTGEVTNYCLKGAPFMNASLESLLAPIWSPDSTQLLIVDRDPRDEDRRRAILVDIIESFAVEIAENVEPVGWMVAP